MRPGRSKAKGNAYERTVCRKLSLWITDGEDSEVLWRSASSGAMATIRMKAKKDTRQHGDITSVDASGNAFVDTYYLECKHLASLHTEKIVFGKAIKSDSSLYNIWLDTKEKATIVGKLPILIARQNNLGEVICLTNTTSRLFFARAVRDIPRHMTVRNYTADLCIFPFDTFLKAAEYHV